MSDVRATWTEAWAAKGESTKETTFRLVMMDDTGTQFAVERSHVDEAGGTSWTLVTYLKDSSTIASELSDAGLSQNVLAAMLGVIFGKRKPVQ